MKADQFPLLLHVALCGLGLDGMREMSLLRAEMLGIRFGDLIRDEKERKKSDWFTIATCGGGEMSKMFTRRGTVRNWRQKEKHFMMNSTRRQIIAKIIPIIHKLLRAIIGRERNHHNKDICRNEILIVAFDSATRWQCKQERNWNIFILLSFIFLPSPRRVKEHQIYSSIRETLSCGSTRVWRNTNNRQFAGWISKRDTSSAASMFGSMWRNKNECNIFINVEACLRRRKFDYLLFCQQKNFLKRWMNPRRCERLAQRKEVFFSLAKKNNRTRRRSHFHVPSEVFKVLPGTIKAFAFLVLANNKVECWRVYKLLIF